MPTAAFLQPRTPLRANSEDLAQIKFRRASWSIVLQARSLHHDSSATGRDALISPPSACSACRMATARLCLAAPRRPRHSPSPRAPMSICSIEDNRPAAVDKPFWFSSTG